MASAISSRSPEMQEEPRTARPVSRRRIIERPRLTRLLDDSPSRILMLVAPAGYGKTTLAQEWVGQKGRHSAWYSGSPATADVAALVAGLAESAAPFLPDARGRIRDLLRTMNAPDERVETLAEVLAEEFAEWPADTWLVIDDYHFARESEASERLVELLVASAAPVPFLIASRQRPAWATARKILYGEIAEFGRNALAMDPSEAAEALSDRHKNEVPGLLALAEGWPAVIGLAALTETLVDPERLSPTLYDYLAEELYRSAGARAQEALAAISLAPVITEALSKHMFGSETEELLRHCDSLGLLTESQGQYFLHPLLRRFLQTKWREFPNARHDVERLVTFFVSQRSWDEAFEIIVSTGLPHLLIGLAERALPAMLAEGRLVTLGRWLAYRDTHALVEPIFDLAEAEINLRRALYAEAEAAALRAAKRFRGTNALRARSLITAGRSAHLSSADERALCHLEEARAVATDAEHVREVVWLQFASAVELERQGCEALLTEFESLTAYSAEDHLRALTGRILLSNRFGTVRNNHLLDASPLLELAHKTKDPMVRSSFLNVYAYMLILAGRYEDGLLIAQSQLRELERSRLTFAIPHMLQIKANALIGLTRFTEAFSCIGEAQQHAQRAGDPYVVMNVGILHARYFVSQREFGQALRYVSTDYDASAPALMDEVLAIRSLTLSCLGDYAQAAEASRQANSTSCSPEVAVLISCAAAIRALREDPRDTKASRVAVALARRVGISDPLVLAYRAYPRFLQALATDTANFAHIIDVVTQARDERLFQAVDLSLRGSAPSELLTPRERDVYSLLGDGLANRAIARRLFISEVTVKVHVRHVFEKLGVRSRTEVALIAAEERRSL